MEVDGSVGDERPREASGRGEHAPKDKPHDGGPPHPSPTSPPPNLVQGSEYDRRYDDPEKGDQQTPEEELLTRRARHGDEPQAGVPSAVHSRPESMMQRAGPSEAPDQHTRR